MSGRNVIFWVSVLLLGYTYLGYPTVMFVWARFRPRPLRPRPSEPTVTVVIVAYNEAARIRGRLENLLSLDYPRDRLEILFGSDGSTDGTAGLARAYEEAGVRVIAFEARRGKGPVLNDLVPKARGEIVVFADARQRFAPDALRALAAPFGDPDVGAVGGELILDQGPEGTPVGEGVGAYWRYEKFIRRNEGRADSTVSATGAIYAIRRDLFEPVPDGTIVDDWLIPVRIAARGYRVLFEPGALAYDRVAATAEEEFTRKVRTIAGQFQLFARQPWLVNPLRNRLWLQTVSHVGLRLVTPLLLIAALGANLLLMDGLFYRWTLAAQIVFYGAAAAGYSVRNARKKIPILSVPYVLCLLSGATVVGFFRFVTRRQRVTWAKASDLPSAARLRRE